MTIVCNTCNYFDVSINQFDNLLQKVKNLKMEVHLIKKLHDVEFHNYSHESLFIASVSESVSALRSIQLVINYGISNFLNECL